MMDSNYANAGGGGGVGGAVDTATAAAAMTVGRLNPLVSCQRSASTYNVYDPYGVSSAGVRTSSAYPYDAEAEFKERTGMGKTVKTSHLQQVAGNFSINSAAKIQQQQQHSYNTNSCYGSYNQSAAAALAPDSTNYYAYAYDHQRMQYPQQQQQYPPQSQFQQQYKYNISAKTAVTGQQQQVQSHHHHHQQQQQSLTGTAVNAANAAMKLSPPEYGYAPYHHFQHPYYHPHYHHTSQKGGVGVLKTVADASAMPYVSNKLMHSTTMGASRGHQYQSNYPYHPHSYQSAVSVGHHTYQSQSVCDDSRWMWNNSSGNEYSNSCRSAYPAAAAYMNGPSAKQTNMWPSMQMQYQNTLSTGYPTANAATNQTCCSSAQNAVAYYPQHGYVKATAMDYSGSSNDLYSSSQGGTVLSSTAAPAKLYTDLNAQPQPGAYQTMNAAFHQPTEYNASSALDYNTRYLQQQQTDSPSSSSTSSTSSYNHHYYHPYAHQTYSTAEQQESLYAQQQVENKISQTTKSQSLRDFLTSWNEDEEECSDRIMSSTDVPFMEPLHLNSDHFGQPQEQHHNGMSSHIVENHLQFKGSFTSRPKIHVGITVDSTVEADQYINLPDIIIDIEKSNKDVLTLPEDILVTSIPKTEKDSDHQPIIKEEPEIKPKTAIYPKKSTTSETAHKDKVKFRRKLCKRVSRLQRLRLIQRNHRKLKVPHRSLLRPKVRRVKKSVPPKYPQSLKCLCVSLINSEKFRNRILGPSEIDNLINLNLNLTTDSDHISSAASSTSEIPKLSDLCKNALNSSFDRDVLVINLDEILASDNLFVVQCDINENILENYVHQQQQDEPNNDLVGILNDNNNNYNRGSSSTSGNGNYLALTAPNATTTTPNKTTNSNDSVLTQSRTPAIGGLKRCCSATEVSNLPLDNAFEHNDTSNPAFASPPCSPCSSSCPAELCTSTTTNRIRLPLIEQNCQTQQITVGHEQLHDHQMLMSGIPSNVNNISASDRHQLNDTTSDDNDLLFLGCSSPAVATPSIHHEEIVPDNLKKFQNEKFLKYLHAKYVQGNLSQFYHANRIIKKYKKRIIKKILNIVR